MSSRLYYPPLHIYRLTANQFRDYSWEKSAMSKQLLLSLYRARATKEARLAGAKEWRVENHRGQLILEGKVR